MMCFFCSLPACLAIQNDMKLLNAESMTDNILLRGLVMNNYKLFFLAMLGISRYHVQQGCFVLFKVS